MTPAFYLPDGSLSTQAAVSLSQDRAFFRGTAPSGVVALQVSVDGGAYLTDPSLYVLAGVGFTIPNPLYEPDGLLLGSPYTRIAVRAILSSGAVTGAASFDCVRIAAPSGLAAPTGVILDPDAGGVTVRSPLKNPGATALNIYGSVDPEAGPWTLLGSSTAPVEALDPLPETAEGYTLSEVSATSWQVVATPDAGSPVELTIPGSLLTLTGTAQVVGATWAWRHDRTTMNSVDLEEPLYYRVAELAPSAATSE